jgi:hypothetical protein
VAVDASVGKPCTFHDLRHTHAALLIAQGEHPKVIQERLGHASIKTTLDTYGHLFAESELAKFVVVEYEKVSVGCGIEMPALIGSRDACVHLSMGVEGFSCVARQAKRQAGRMLAQLGS